MTEMFDKPRPIGRDDDDTQGHALKWGADAETTEGDDDTEGHALRWGADAETTEGDDDTEGHVVKCK
jgi:hypothetical protein